MLAINKSRVLSKPENPFISNLDMTQKVRNDHPKKWNGQWFQRCTKIYKSSKYVTPYNVGPPSYKLVYKSH